MRPLLVTASLLSSWLWYLQDESDNAKESFLTVLRREQTPDNPAMKSGRAFETRVRFLTESNYQFTERDVADVAETADDVDDDYNECVKEVADIVSGGAWQASSSIIVNIGGVEFCLYGRRDVLKGAWVYDLKFTKTFEIGKYLDSPQTEMYIRLTPEVLGMKYLACDGKTVYEDSYLREDVGLIDTTVQNFWNWLGQNPEMKEIYCEKWQSKGDR